MVGLGFLALALTASCATNRGDTTGSIPNSHKPVDQMSAAEIAGATRSVGAAYAKNPKDRNTGLQYASLLRMTGKSDQALAVMRQVAILYPKDREVLAAYGKALASAGDLEQALGTISRAQTPDRPDWKLKSAEGAILDQLGRSDAAGGGAKLRLAHLVDGFVGIGDGTGGIAAIGRAGGGERQRHEAQADRCVPEKRFPPRIRSHRRTLAKSGAAGNLVQILPQSSLKQ